MKEAVVSHVSLSFSGSGNPNCFVNVLFFFFFDHKTFTEEAHLHLSW